jgi:hypothetical protein
MTYQIEFKYIVNSYDLSVITLFGLGENNIILYKINFFKTEHDKFVSDYLMITDKFKDFLIENNYVTVWPTIANPYQNNTRYAFQLTSKSLLEIL